jgi:type IV pilus assembly protein PilE
MKLLNPKMKKFSIFNFQFLNNSAFTLLEMLVVIGIISVIVSMGFVSYSTSQKKARDAKRKTDLKAIQSAFEQYYSICGYKYPSSVPASGSKLTATTTNCPVSSNVDLITMPADPLGGSYSCNNTCDTTIYTICSPVVSGTSRLETETCTSGSSCCVSNQQ